MTHKEELERAYMAGFWIGNATTFKPDFEQWYNVCYPTTPKIDTSQSSKEILDYLSERSGINYKYTSSNLLYIRRRLKEGYTTDDLRKVIDNMFAEWGNTEMKKYLRPITLFRASKIDGYLGRTVRKPVSEMTDEELRKL